MTVKNFINTSGDLDYPTVLPTLDLDFANSKSLDPRITFTRSSGGSYVAPDGLIKYAGVNQPRFDHDPTTGESLGLMIGEQRTNITLQSENFATTWFTTRSSILSNVTTSPDGTVTADKLIGDISSNQTHFVGQVFSFTSGTTYTYSVYVKAEEVTQIRIAGANETVWPGVITFDLKNGKILNTILGTGVIQSLGNGWYRCSVTATAVASLNTNILNYLSVNNTINFTGNNKNGIYIWGAQLEETAFPTSYIPTLGSTRTRAADRVSMTGTKFSSWYNQSEGTTYWNASRKYDIPSSNSPGVWNVSDSLGANAISHSFLTNTLSSFNVFSNNKQVALIYPPTKVTPLLNRKSSGAYKIKDYATSLNGSLYKSNVSGPVPIVTQLNIGGNQFGNTSNILNGTISRLTYYPKRLPDSQLQALTR